MPYSLLDTIKRYSDLAKMEVNSSRTKILTNVYLRLYNGYQLIKN